MFYIFKPFSIGKFIFVFHLGTQIGKRTDTFDGEKVVYSLVYQSYCPLVTLL